MPKASFLNMEEEEGGGGQLFTEQDRREIFGEPESPVTSNTTIYIAPGYIDLDPVTSVRLGDESEESDAEFAAQLDCEGGGQPTPILVRPSETAGRYKIIAGRRRLRAMTRLGKGILAVVLDVDDQMARRLAFEENYRRKQFSPVELARLFIEARGENWKPNWSERVAKKFGVSRATITESIKMYDGLAAHPELLGKVHHGELRADAAIELAKQKEESSEVFAAAQRIAVEEAATRVGKTGKTGKAGKGKKAGQTAAEVRDSQDSPGEGVAEPGQDKKGKDKPVQVKKKHVKAAVKAAGKSKGSSGPLNRAEIVDGLLRLVDPTYPPVMSAFLNYAMTDWVRGKGDLTVLKQHWQSIACLVDERTPGCGGSGDPVVQRVPEALENATTYRGLAKAMLNPKDFAKAEKEVKKIVKQKMSKKKAVKKVIAKKSVTKSAKKPRK